MEQAGYVLNPQSGIWASPDFTGIAYSDGDEVEQRLARLIAATTDRSVLSDELKQHITDWPSLYHLSSSRANILRPFEPRLAGAQVLEIGAGCGAITRYLGNAGHRCWRWRARRGALASPARASDLPGVEVLRELDNSAAAHNSMSITLIGVLEYANQFVPGTNPTLAMLERARAMLKLDGLLLIAIENQLGLKDGLARRRIIWVYRCTVSRAATAQTSRRPMGARRWPICWLPPVSNMRISWSPLPGLQAAGLDRDLQRPEQSRLRRCCARVPKRAPRSAIAETTGFSPELAWPAV